MGTLEGLHDHERYEVSYREVTYAVRILANGVECPRIMYVLVPST